MAIETISVLDAAGVSRTVLADLIGADYGQVVKQAFGIDGSLQMVDGTHGLPAEVVAALPAGTNNIGDMDVLTVPAMDRTTDAVAAALQTGVIMNGFTALTPKFATIAAATSGNNTLVAAVAAKKIRVLQMLLVSTGTVNVYLADGAGTPVALIGNATNKVALVAGTGFVIPFTPVGWTETSVVNVAVNLNLSAAVAVAGVLAYVEV